MGGDKNILPFGHPACMSQIYSMTQQIERARPTGAIANAQPATNDSLLPSFLISFPRYSARKISLRKVA